MTNIHGQAHGDAPSRTSQWYSIDLGLIHFVMLDLDPGPPAVFAGAQAAWAAAFTDACAERQAQGSPGSSCRGGRAQTADASWLSGASAQGPPSPRRAASLPNLHLRSQ